MRQFTITVFSLALLSGFVGATNLPLCPAAAIGPEPLVAIGNPTNPRFLRAEPGLLPDPTVADEATLDAFGKQLAYEGIRMIVVSLPPSDFIYGSKDIYGPTYDSAPQIARYRRSVIDFRRVGFGAVDVLSLANQVEASGHPFFALRDHHWSAEGLQAAANAVKALVDASPLDIQRDAVTTLTARQGSLNGSYDNLVRAACGQQTYSDEQRTFFDLSLISGESLLGDASTDIVVMGDSYGINYFGFPQVLSDALKTPVVGVAQNGGGAVGGFTDGLMSLTPDTKPQLIVYVANTIIVNSADIREYSATLDTILHPPPPSVVVTAKAEATPVTLNLPSVSASATQQYVQMTLSGPRVESVPVTLTYVDGRSESRIFHRNQSNPAQIYSNVFSFALPNRASLKSVAISAPAGTIINVSVHSFEAPVIIY